MGSKNVIIYLEHDTRKPIKHKLRTKGIKGMYHAGRIGNWIRQGYRLVEVEGDPEDPIYQQIVGWMDQHKETGKIKVDLGQIRQTASKVTGASVEDIKKRMDKTLDKWKSRFKGVVLK